MQENAVGDSILNELNAWKTREKDLELIFTQDAFKSRVYQLEKLKSFKAIARKSKPQNQNEKVTLSLLKADIRKLEKTLYKNRIVRYYHRYKPLKVLGKMFNGIIQKLPFKKEDSYKSLLKEPKGIMAPVKNMPDSAKKNVQSRSTSIKQDLAAKKSTKMSVIQQIIADHHNNQKQKAVSNKNQNTPAGFKKKLANKSQQKKFKMSR